MGKQAKYYVVWKGRQTGVFDSWTACHQQVNGCPGASYKSYPTRGMAEHAFSGGGEQAASGCIPNSIAVDAAWNTITGVVEYQGVEMPNKKLLFRAGPFQDGTINIGEFLAIVHALMYCRQHDFTLPIYSDSNTAIIWVRNAVANTHHPRTDRNKKLFALLDAAVQWLKENDYANPLVKWETKMWGENPADFGRK